MKQFSREIEDSEIGKLALTAAGYAEKSRRTLDPKEAETLLAKSAKYWAEAKAGLPAWTAAFVQQFGLWSHQTPEQIETGAWGQLSENARRFWGNYQDDHFEAVMALYEPKQVEVKKTLLQEVAEGILRAKQLEKEQKKEQELSFQEYLEKENPEHAALWAGYRENYNKQLHAVQGDH